MLVSSLIIVLGLALRVKRMLKCALMTQTRKRSLTDWAASNTAEWRKAAGMSQEQLAERMTSLGVPMSRATVANLESKRREDLTLDEAAALAVALNVRVCDLLTPGDGREDVAVLPTRVVIGFTANGWLTGKYPLGSEDEHDFLRHAPQGLRDEAKVAMREPWRAIGRLQTDVRYALVGVADSHKAGVANALEEELERVNWLVRDLAASLRQEADDEEGGG